MNKYEKYKDSGFDWIGEIPEHWGVKKLKYLAFANPSNIDKKSKKEEKEVFLCNYVDVYKNDFIRSGMKFMKATASDSQIEKFILEKGDVIATKDSETSDDIGVPALVIENFEDVVCGYHLTHIKPTEINGAFLFRFFQTQYLKSYFEVSANGVTRYGLGVDKINSAFIIEPPIEEQTAIANYLDHKTTEIDELINQKEQLLKLYEKEKTAIINQAVTKGINTDVKLKDSGIDWLGEIPGHWKVRKLKYVAEIQGGFAFSSTDFTNDGIQLMKISNLYQNELHLERQSTFLPEHFLESHPEWIVNNGNILMSMTGTLGKRDYGYAILIENCDDKYLLNQRVSKIHSVKELNINLLLYSLRSEYFLNNLFSLPAGTKQGNFSNENIMNQSIAFPNKGEQMQIVKFIKGETIRINTKAEKTKKLIDLLKEYKQSLISEVVTGKVKVF